uniref:RNA-guided endonuclease InsQ/TnpB family protein n=1 Tax=uncultured Clostridium sp. TaxID=59620 RepID=UPI00260DA787
KARKKAIQNAETAYKRFFKGQSKFPKFKKKNKSDVKLYFPKNNKGDWKVDRHRIMIPTLKNVRLKEYGYIPVGAKVISGTVSKKANRYYVSVIIDTEIIQQKNINQGIGIDLGLKDFAICSNTDKPYKNINKTQRVKKLEKKLLREQRKLSRKYESLKLKNKKEKGEATRQNIQKQIVRVQILHQKLTNIRTDYINKVVNSVVRNKPQYITIEDLNVKGLMKNKHLSKAVAQQKFYEFRNKLTNKCHALGIELRIVDRFYPSSKCHCCGSIKKDLKLKDRIYRCECGYVEDRDYNASLNLRDAKIYKIA